MRVNITNWKKFGAGLLAISAVFAFLSLQTKAASQSDAIAVRVMPNTNHDSIETWYANQGYKGSPQSLVVDGYDAIRDGRTVFVNAANIDTNNHNIYTNIYLISYNQESEEKTLDILGQLVSHWKFNSNITEAGHCSISNTHCLADSDCQSGYICSNPSGGDISNKGKCVLANNKDCNIDSDCPVNLFCDNLKSRLIRDVKRLGELNQINTAIESYKTANGTYPSLQSGTYILGKSISVWPSWKETLGAQLGLSQSLIDPINTLGYCDGYDSVTCWDNKTNTFVNSDLSLPNGSYAFAYKATNNGTNYSLCSVFETRDLGSYDTVDGKITANSCSVNSYKGSDTNTAPFVVSSYTEGESGKEFNGYVKAKDTEGDSISWRLWTTSPTPWLSWRSGSTIIPVLQDTGDPSQKKIYAPKAGNAGSYEMNLTLTDSRGAATTTKLTFVISAAGKPRIEADDIDYFVDPVNPLKYTFFVEGSNSKPTYTISSLNSNYSAYVAQMAAKASVTSVGLNKDKVDISYVFPTSASIPSDVTIPLLITAKADGMFSGKTVNFNLKTEKPYLNFQCENIARIEKAYPINGSACLLGGKTSGNHTINYKVLSGPSGLNITSDEENYYLTADSIVVSAPTTTQVKIGAVNEYGVTSEKVFDLTINSFCGDGKKQRPNTEGHGGLYNDGVEECDGEDGVWTRNDVVSHNPAIQYACTSGLNIKSPYPIMDNNSCVFKAADAGGGYCGDGICQATINSKEMENCSNCSEDCGTCVCTPNCSVNMCGDDGCGGSCGDCDSGETCVNGSCCVTSANVQVCADNEHVTYLNATQVASGSDWGSIQKFPVSVANGTNIFAIKATDWGSQYGVSATLNLSGCRNKNGVVNSLSMNTNSIDNWKCTGFYHANWNTLNYDDSSWPVAKNMNNTGPSKGNALPYKQIWASDITSGKGTTSVYCRYSFSTLTAIDAGCVPVCSGKCGGSDGCGGYCPDNCVSPQTCGGGGVQFVCGEEKTFVCTPKCTNKCGGSDGCGSLCPNTCLENQVCVLPANYCKDYARQELIITPGQDQAK